MISPMIKLWISKIKNNRQKLDMKAITKEQNHNYLLFRFLQINENLYIIDNEIFLFITIKIIK